MPRKAQSQSRQRWSRWCAENILRPINPDHLPIVLEFLRPFKFRSEDAANDAGFAAEMDLKQVGVSEELARRLIEQAARAFNEAEYLEHDAPRISDVRREFSQLMRASTQLKQVIEQLSFFSLCKLRHVPSFNERIAQLAIAANIEGLPLPTSDAGDTALWVRRLDALIRLAELKLRGLSVDTGGNTNLWRQAFGSANWGIVHDAFTIYDLFKPDTATTTPGGPFHQFVLAIYEYATGKPPEDHATLDDTIKDLVVPSKLDRALEIEQDRLMEENRQILESKKPLSDTERGRLDSNDRRLGEIFRQRRPLWKKTWPHFK